MTRQTVAAGFAFGGVNGVRLETGAALSLDARGDGPR